MIEISIICTYNENASFKFEINTTCTFLTRSLLNVNVDVNNNNNKNAREVRRLLCIQYVILLLNRETVPVQLYVRRKCIDSWHRRCCDDAGDLRSGGIDREENKEDGRFLWKETTA